MGKMHSFFFFKWVIICALTTIWETLRIQKGSFICCVDFMKAFDSVWESGYGQS